MTASFYNHTVYPTISSLILEILIAGNAQLFREFSKELATKKLGDNYLHCPYSQIYAVVLSGLISSPWVRGYYFSNFAEKLGINFRGFSRFYRKLKFRGNLFSRLKEKTNFADHFFVYLRLFCYLETVFGYWNRVFYNTKGIVFK